MSQQTEQSSDTEAPPAFDLESDEPLQACPLRPENGEACEACQ